MAKKKKAVRNSTCSWWRSANTSRWSAAGDRASPQREHEREQHLDHRTEAYPPLAVTSTGATRTDFSIGTTLREPARTSVAIICGLQEGLSRDRERAFPNVSYRPHAPVDFLVRPCRGSA